MTLYVLVGVVHNYPSEKCATLSVSLHATEASAKQENSQAFRGAGAIYPREVRP